MNPLTTFESWYGRNEPPPEIVTLRAGHLHTEFEHGDLRYLRYGDVELIRRIYCAVRDVNWNTIPAHRTNLSIISADDHFQIRFDAFHQDGPLAFRWYASIEGRPDGSIEYVMSGTAESDFRYCRIGFCVLHPIAGIAGSPYNALTPQGEVSGTLPELIEPQRMENGFETPIFPSCSKLAVRTPSGIQIVTEFEGDLFEMEDQRNWTDGSFKTYCTPIALGYPHSASKGQVFYQKVTVRAESLAKALPTQPATKQPIHLSLGAPTQDRLPKIGFGVPGREHRLTPRELELVSRLRPDHLKVEIHFQESGWLAELDQAIQAAAQTNSALELAIFLTDDSEPALAMISTRLATAPVAQVIVFHESEAPIGTTSPRWMHQVRRQLGSALPGVPLYGGTNGNFAELNRQRPDVSVMDGVAYTINPQVHLPDERSLVEAIEAQHDSVATGRSFCGTLPISVSSVTLKPPFNQAAREEEAPPDPHELPPAVDPRQMSLFAAAWTVGSLRSLAMGGADSITYYELAGWRGLMETGEGSPLPAKFRSFPGMIYPVYWVFEFLASARDAVLLKVVCDEPLLVEGLAFKQDDRLGVLVANLQPKPQQIHLMPVPGKDAALKRLNEDTLALASTDPDAFLAFSETLVIREQQASLELKPYETAFLECYLP